LFQSIRKVDRAEAVFEILQMEEANRFYLGAKSRFEAGRKNRDTVFVPFFFPDSDLFALKIYIFHAQAYTLHQTQTGTVEEACHQKMRAGKMRENGFDLFRGEDYRKSLRVLGAFYSFDIGQFHLENIAIEKEKRMESDILRRGGNILLYSQMRKVGANFSDSQIFGMALAMKNDIALNGREIGLFGAIGEMFESQNPAHLFQKIAY
jgi:hypothetical protein